MARILKMFGVRPFGLYRSGLSKVLRKVVHDGIQSLFYFLHFSLANIHT